MMAWIDDFCLLALQQHKPKAVQSMSRYYPFKIGDRVEMYGMSRYKKGRIGYVLTEPDVWNSMKVKRVGVESVRSWNAFCWKLLQARAEVWVYCDWLVENGFQEASDSLRKNFG